MIQQFVADRIFLTRSTFWKLWCFECLPKLTGKPYLWSRLFTSSDSQTWQLWQFRCQSLLLKLISHLFELLISEIRVGVTLIYLSYYIGHFITCWCWQHIIKLIGICSLVSVAGNRTKDGVLLHYRWKLLAHWPHRLNPLIIIFRSLLGFYPWYNSPIIALFAEVTTNRGEFTSRTT